MSEYLAFNQAGQWELHKATNPKTGDQIQPATVGKPYKVFRGAALNGDLHQDFGQKGSLHDHNGGARPKNSVNFKNAGKPYKNLPDVYSERNPGVGSD